MFQGSLRCFQIRWERLTDRQKKTDKETLRYFSLKFSEYSTRQDILGRETGAWHNGSYIAEVAGLVDAHARKLQQQGRAGNNTHLLNQRELNARYHDAGRYGRFGRGKPPTTDGNSTTVHQALFSAPKPKDFVADNGLHTRLEGGAANLRLEGAAGASSTATAELEPLLHLHARSDFRHLRERAGVEDLFWPQGLRIPAPRRRVRGHQTDNRT